MSFDHQTSESGRPSGLVYAFVVGTITVAAFIEVSKPPRAFAWVTYLCALAAVAVTGAAVVVGTAAAPVRDDTAGSADRLRRPGPAYQPEAGTGTGTAHERPIDPRSDSRQPTLTWPYPQRSTLPPPAAQVPSPRAVTALSAQDELSKAPKFGRGSSAHSKPWRIPARPFPNGIAADQAQVGPFAVRGASVVGPGHRCGGRGGSGSGEPRQDAYRIGRTLDDRFVVLAVADGISNAQRSDTGATVAASRAVQILRGMLDVHSDPAELDALAVFKQTAEHVANAAADRQAASRDVATVLIAAVLQVPDRPGASARGWAAWVGDSSGWILNAAGTRWEQRFGDTKNQGEYASNGVSSALPDSPEAVRAMEFDLRPGAAFALTTDGIADAWGNEAINRYFAQRWRAPLPAAEFLNDVDFDAPQRMDDRTAVVVWNGAGS
ncbi:serine/threonine protein phosphatase PrpC [Catenulispora sp. GAS73]|uniref:protein phosphatase 2C domain-containing protein n=1 Tax=Catenulispora sp. GAS73 TaxID=3156269 RepID=UPI003513974B